MSDVLVIGCGPAGLAIAACLERQGVGATLVDAFGEPGGAYRRMYGAITLSSPTAFLGLPHLPFKSPRAYVSVDEYNGYLARYAQGHSIAPRVVRVERIERRGDAFAVGFQNVERRDTYRAVIVATGMSDHPHIPEIPGLAKGSRKGTLRVVHSDDWRGPAEYRDARLLIVGGGMRAVEIAEECAQARQPVTIGARRKIAVTANWPWLDVRSLWFPFTRYLSRLSSARRRHCEKPVTFPAIDRGYLAGRRAGLIRERSELLAIEDGQATFKTGPREPFDAVALATGYRHVCPFLPSAVACTPNGFPIARENESVSWPGLYFLGSPCAGGAYSQFIHGISQDARRLARTIRRRLVSG